MAGQGGDDDDVPATGGRDFGPHNCVRRVIAPLEDEIRLEGFDQFKRRVLLEDSHAVDKGELGQHGGAPVFVLPLPSHWSTT